MLASTASELVYYTYEQHVDKSPQHEFIHVSDALASFYNSGSGAEGVPFPPSLRAAWRKLANPQMLLINRFERACELLAGMRCSVQHRSEQASKHSTPGCEALRAGDNETS